MTTFALAILLHFAGSTFASDAALDAQAVTEYISGVTQPAVAEG